MGRRQAAAFTLLWAFALPSIGSSSTDSASGRKRVIALGVVTAATPRFNVLGYHTSGSIPQVTSPGLELRRVNAALREAVLDDQRSYAVSAAKYAKRNPHGCGGGVYKVTTNRRLLSASSAIVSVLLPATELYPCGNDGQLWVSTTVRVPSGERVTLAQLFTDPEGSGLQALGVAWFRVIARANDWRLRCVVPNARDYEPTLEHYRYFALTPHGLALAFFQEPACSRIEAIVPYPLLRPYLSASGRKLVAGVRTPR